jgi:hypothetical protein
VAFGKDGKATDVGAEIDNARALGYQNAEFARWCIALVHKQFVDKFETSLVMSNNKKGLRPA